MQGQVLRLLQRAVGSVWPQRLRALALTCFCAGYLLVSVHQGLQQFVNPRLQVWGLASLDRVASHLRLVNTYHLFAQITLERIEPTFWVESEGGWTELSLHHKPGALKRGLPLVAPHQPRVDFLLWFYGLRFRGNPPNYVKALFYRLCHQPAAVGELFVDQLPQRIDGVRVSFWQYHFNTASERASTGELWRREPVAGERTVRCAER